MEKIIELVNIELKRVWKWVVGLLTLFVTLQGIGMAYQINSQLRFYAQQAKFQSITVEEFYKQVGKVNINTFVEQDPIMIIGVGILVALIVLYVLFIWYREWFGSNKTIYTLLMLPIPRMRVYIAKFVTIIVLIGALVSSIIFTSIIDYTLVYSMMPKVLLSNESLMLQIKISRLLQYLLPLDGYLLVIFILLGITMISFIMFFALSERSYGWKGALLAICMGVTYLVCLIGFRVFNQWMFGYEMYYVMVGINISYIIGLTLWNRYLLENKIRIH